MPTASDEERARLRRNQRNSRARKADYLHDLERRWSQCVRSGAQASEELQTAARHVREENSVLRAMLAEYGAGRCVVDRRVAEVLGREMLPTNSIKIGRPVNVGVIIGDDVINHPTTQANTRMGNAGSTDCPRWREATRGAPAQAFETSANAPRYTHRPESETLPESSAGSRQTEAEIDVCEVMECAECQTAPG